DPGAPRSFRTGDPRVLVQALRPARPGGVLRTHGRPAVSANHTAEHGSEQDLLSGVALTSFRLNGQFLEVAESLARPVGLTAAWWQVLGATLTEPLSVAGIARVMGITRQSVQRIADLLVEREL